MTDEHMRNALLWVSGALFFLVELYLVVDVLAVVGSGRSLLGASINLILQPMGIVLAVGCGLLWSRKVEKE